MSSLAKATRQILQEHKGETLTECFQKNIINYRALARAIKKEVATELGREANLEAITTAIRRYVDELRKEQSIPEQKITRTLGQSRTELRSDIAVLTIKMGWELRKKLDDILRDINDGDILHITQDPATTTIVIDQRNLPRFLKKIKQENILQQKTNLTALKVISPPTIAETPGVIDKMTRRLALGNINIVELMSSYNITTFIVNQQEALDTYKIIEELIARCR